MHALFLSSNHIKQKSMARLSLSPYYMGENDLYKIIHLNPFFKFGLIQILFQRLQERKHP